MEQHDSWSLSHLGYLYPGTTPVMIKLTPRWVITRVLLGTDRGTFVMIVGALVTWAIYTQGQLLL